MSNGKPTQRGRFGQTRVVGAPPGTLRNVYAHLLDAKWRYLFVTAAASYFVVNVLFACLYVVGGDCIDGARPGSFADAFNFSVQSISTIGYGGMSPKTTYAHMVVTVEAFVGLMGFAVGAGLVFAKFARPQASVLFSDVAVVHDYHGTPQLLFRVANWRGNDVVHATVQVAVLRSEVSEEGYTMRRLHDLALVRDNSPVFRVTWTVMHILDESSPLYGLTADELQADNAMIIVTLTGLDETYGQTVYARTAYHHDEILFGQRFVDVISAVDDAVQLDLTRFHDTVPVDPA